MTWNRERLEEIAKRAMVERGFLPEFSPAAEKEARTLDEPTSAPAPPTRDLRELCWCSIDNDDSRDLDQLSVSGPGDGGATRVLVAVADVESAVARGSAIDDHARTNTTSVYTPVRIFPMLPERLSTDLTSLNEAEDRLAIVVDLSVVPDGTVAAFDVYPARVRNKAKLAYDAVAAWLDGTGPAPAPLATVAGLSDQLRVQDRVAHAMKATRHQRGALSLESVEARPVFEGGVLTDLRADEKNRAKELIEELMVAANVATSRFLESKGSPSLRRLLRSPDRWDRIVSLAAEHGTRLPVDPDPAALQSFLVLMREKDPQRFPEMSLSVVKLLGSGEYVLQMPGHKAEGHFGLALRDYAHSTAPNRRFPDLVTQRLLKAALLGRPVPYGADELEALARHCTEQEDDAAKVERQVRKSAAASLLTSRIGERFDGIVTGASAKGTWVRLRRPSVEGRLVRGSQGLDVGDRVSVRVVRTDVERGFIDLEA